MRREESEKRKVGQGQRENRRQGIRHVLEAFNKPNLNRISQQKRRLLTQYILNMLQELLSVAI